jgi:2,4-dienoyl-CoA reductase-like NADH-dependent reductase (Old Yellow Enzyme family)
MVDMFTPGGIGSLKIENRMVRSATWLGLADTEGRVTDRLFERIVELAEGGVGLIISGLTGVAPEGRGRDMAGLYDHGQVESHARMVEAVHDAGGRISVQIAHLGAQAREGQLLEGLEAVGPSAVENPVAKRNPRELTAEEIKRIVERFGEAAGYAKQAGYDAIQIHGAHGYMVDQFMSPRFNRRTDEYGDPQRFVMEVYEAVRANAGGAPVLIKLSIDDCLEGSTVPEISLPIARALSDAGIDAIEVSGGTMASGKKSPSRTRLKTQDDEAYFLDFARRVKALVRCPVIGVGGYRSPEVINRVLDSGDVDFVALSRPLIREPALIRRWKDGDLAPARCISCNRCFHTTDLGDGIQCYKELQEQGRVK